MMVPRRATKVAIVEDHSLFAEALQIALDLEGYDVRQVPFQPGVHAPTALLAPILRSQPRMVLLDLDLGPYGSGMRLVEPLTQAGVAVVVVTSSPEEARWGEAVCLGARKVMLKAVPLRDILATLRRIQAGLPVMSPDERQSLLNAWHGQGKEIRELRTRLESLTHREAEVLGHLMAGHHVGDIASDFVVSDATVRSQVKAILAKLGVSSQLAAVGAAHRARWEPPRK